MRADGLNLRHLRAVTAIAECGSVSAAARLVSLTQPAITQAIAKLESHMDIKLFDRIPNGMVPTRAGQLLALRAARALQMVGSSRVTAPQARALVALARHGSYSAAAAAVGLREPSLHRAVVDLSISMGQTLVERRGRGVVLTPRGVALGRRFRLAQAELASGLAELDQLRGHEVGRVSVGAMPLSRAWLLPEAIGKFHRLHPDVDIAVVEGSHAELLGPLRDGEIDLMIGALRSVVPADLKQEALFEDTPVVLGSSEHPLALAGDPPTVDQLARFPWVVPALGTPLRSQWARMFESSGIVPPRVAIECGSVLVIRRLLLDDDFLTFLSPAQVAVELEAGWLTRIAAAVGSARTIGVTTRAAWQPTRLQHAFLDLVKAQAKSIDPDNS